MFRSLLYLSLPWLIANLSHALWIGLRRKRWERQILRDANGLLPFAAPFSAGTGPTAVLMVHGFADTPRVWRRFADRLTASGALTCLALRLPGSAQPLDQQAKRSPLDDWREAIDRELDRLRETHASVWILGHSLGGALALDAALRRPEAVTGVGALAPMLAISQKRSPLLPPAAWLRLACVALAASPVFESCFSAEAEATDDPTFRYPRDRFIPFAVYQSLFDLIRANQDRARELSLPIYAALSSHDSVVDTPAAQRWLAACRGDVLCRTFDDTSHELPLETGWRELADGFAAFIRAHA